MPDIHRIGLTRSNAEIWGSSKYSDLTVRCGSQDFKLHRAIVCPRSTFFAAACDGQFQEAQTCTIVLKEDDPPTVRRMLTYLYTLTYDDKGDAASAEHYMVNGTKSSKTATTPSPPHSEEELLRHAKMMNNVVVCAIAQKYDISELKELATSKFRKLLWLKAPSPSLPHVVDAVFDTTSTADSGLRSVVTEYCAHYSTRIVADNQLSSMIKDHGELGLDVLRQHNAEKQKERVTLENLLAEMVDYASEIDEYSYSRTESRTEWSALQKNLNMVYEIIKKN